MKIAFIIRSTFKEVPGGDTVQAEQTATELRKLGVDVDILTTGDRIDYKAYDIFHFFNLIRPADILFHLDRIQSPSVISPILVDYSEYEKYHRPGIRGSLLRRLPANSIEYTKTIGRWVLGKDALRSRRFIFRGQRRSMAEITRRVSALLPNSASEQAALGRIADTDTPYYIIPNGIDPGLFHPDPSITRDTRLVVCAARIEGIKNQLNLVRALNNTEFTLWLIGTAGPNHRRYYDACRKEAAANVHFKIQLSQPELATCYQLAGVHALPSWFETCGLSSLEAAASGCNIVITEKGYTRDYFGEDGSYCDPIDPASIYRAVKGAAEKQPPVSLQQRINQHYTWAIAAGKTLDVYNKLLAR